MLRSSILDRDNKCCIGCGCSNCLQVHHIKKKINGGEDIPENLITLCSVCHEMIHGKNCKKKNLLQSKLSKYMYILYRGGTNEFKTKTR